MEGLDKAEIARRQLGAALAFFLENLDPVTVHVLACGGGEVAQRLTRKADATPFQDTLNLDDETYKRLRNRYWNAFKHATTRQGLDRNDEELLAAFTDEANDHVLLAGWTDYARAGLPLPAEAQVFLGWYYARNPERVRPGQIRDDSVRAFGGNLHEVERVEAKRRLLVVIGRVRADPEFQADPRTDQRPLVLRA